MFRVICHTTVSVCFILSALMFGALMLALPAQATEGDYSFVKPTPKEIIAAAGVKPDSDKKEKDGDCLLRRVRWYTGKNQAEVSVEFRCNRINVAFYHYPEPSFKKTSERAYETARKIVASIVGHEGLLIGRIVEGGQIRDIAATPTSPYAKLNGQCESFLGLCMLTFRPL